MGRKPLFVTAFFFFFFLLTRSKHWVWYKEEEKRMAIFLMVVVGEKPGLLETTINFSLLSHSLPQTRNGLPNNTVQIGIELELLSPLTNACLPYLCCMYCLYILCYNICMSAKWLDWKYEVYELVGNWICGWEWEMGRQVGICRHR